MWETDKPFQKCFKIQKVDKNPEKVTYYRQNRTKTRRVLLSEARPERSRDLGWVRKKVNKQNGTPTSNFVPGQTIDFSSLICAFFFLFKAPKT